MSVTSNHAVPSEAAGVLSLAVWFGLGVGLVEGVGLLVLQPQSVNVRILWIAALFELLLFFFVGLCLWIGKRLFVRLPPGAAAIFVLGFLTFLNWTLLTERVSRTGSFFLALGLATVLVRLHRKRPGLLPHVSRVTLPWLGATAVAALLLIEGGFWLRERQAEAKLPPAARGAPNVLVILMDTVRADHLSVYGYSRQTTPSLQRLANEGVAFDHAFSTSDWTLPAHASLLTGLYPHEHGAEKNHFDRRSHTISEELRNHGYRTGAFSANLFWFTRSHGFGKCFLHFEDILRSVPDAARRVVFGRAIEDFLEDHGRLRDIPGRMTAEQINRAALDWIDANPSRPFFVFLNYLDAHSPYRPPQPFWSKFSDKKEPGGRLHGRILRTRPRLTPEQLRDEIDAYDGAIAYVDHQVGELLGELKQRGLDQNTIVVVTSDHGELFDEHGLFTHRIALYYDLIRVPLILRWPSRIPVGMRMEQPASLAWLPATLLDLLGGREAGAFPGPSLTQAWEDPEKLADWPHPLQELAQMPFKQFAWVPAYSGAMKSLVTPRFHYIVHEKSGEQLYEWVEDPKEQHDLMKTPEGKRVGARLKAKLEDLLETRVAGRPSDRVKDP